MGQNRRDSGPQRAAKTRWAENSRCPKCGRGGALRRGRDVWDDLDARVYVAISECRWRDSGECDHREAVETRIPFPPEG
jgi:hypothetical protein